MAGRVSVPADDVARPFGVADEARAAWTVPLAGRRLDVVFLLVLLIGLGLRVQLGAGRPYVHDEENTAIPLARTLSFAPGYLNLPLRGENHGALPAYIVRASSALFGTSRLGYRGLHVLGGLLAVCLVYAIARQWHGIGAARWAAALLAFNEYFLDVSSRATAHVPHLLLACTAIWAVSRFLRTERPVYLYATGLALGVAFYAKEHSALLLPLFFLALLQTSQRRWLLRPRAWVAVAVFALCLLPDVAWNLRTDPEAAAVDYAGQTLGQATYASHLRRIGGLGLSPYPLMFYARPVVQAASRLTTGAPLADATPEYQSMNPVLGLLVLAGVLATLRRPRGVPDVGRLLLTVFCGIVVFFTLIRPGSPPGRLDPVSWIWVEVSMFPAVVLAGGWLAGLTGPRRIVAWGVTIAALAYAARLLAV